MSEWLELTWSRYEDSYYKFQASIVRVADFEACLVPLGEKPIGLIAASEKSDFRCLSLPEANTFSIETFIAASEFRSNSKAVQAAFLNHIASFK